MKWCTEDCQEHQSHQPNYPKQRHALLLLACVRSHGLTYLLASASVCDDRVGYIEARLVKDSWEHSSQVKDTGDLALGDAGFRVLIPPSCPPPGPRPSREGRIPWEESIVSGARAFCLSSRPCHGFLGPRADELVYWRLMWAPLARANHAHEHRGRY